MTKIKARKAENEKFWFRVTVCNLLLAAAGITLLIFGLVITDIFVVTCSLIILALCRTVKQLEDDRAMCNTRIFKRYSSKS